MFFAFRLESRLEEGGGQRDVMEKSIFAGSWS